MMHVLLSLVAYLLGSIPFGLIVSKLWAEIDIRQHGSGNIGMTNVMRTVGYLPGLVTLLLDVAKGYVPVLLARQVSGDPTTALIIGVFAIAGHNWSVFLRFKGGKGVATTAGVFLGVAPGIALALFVIFLGVVVLTRDVSLGSILAAVSLPILLIFYRFPWPIVLLGVLISVFTIVRHRANISRLLAGTEYRFGDKAR